MLSISIPKAFALSEKRERMEIPLYTSPDSARRMQQYETSNGISFSIKGNGKIKLAACVTKKPNLVDDKKISDVVGVDVGITDMLFTSDGHAIGTFSESIKFYKNEAEPLLGQLSSMRNKKRRLKRYLRKHKGELSQAKILEIRALMDRIEYVIRHSTKAYHKCNHYHNMVEHEVRMAVDTYIKYLNGNKNILTALELLDIKEFRRSRTMNGRFSMFARSLLSSKLMETLNWCGYHFVQVEPAYTSQICPNCLNLDPKNRGEHDKKTFKCTCCGYSDDADHVGSVNIKSRVTDAELSSLCEKSKKSDLHRNIKALFKERHEMWRKLHPDQIRSIEESNNEVVVPA